MHCRGGTRSSDISDADLLRAMETKSVLPSVATLQMAQLLGAGPPSPAAAEAATTLGRVLWRIDDLADLIADCRRGVRSALVARVGEIARADGRAEDRRRRPL